jgi:uncharacterized protein (TIGR03435 family)
MHKHVLKLGLLIATFSFAATRQQPESWQFDVASIKPSPPDAVRTVEALDTLGGRPNALQFVTFDVRGRVTASAATLRQLTAAAYGIPIDRVVGGPSWADSQRYQVEGKAPTSAMVQGDVRTSYRRLVFMLQAMLADRFKLKSHRVKTDVPVYELTVAKNGPKFLEAKRDCSPVTSTRVAGLEQNCHAIADAGPARGAQAQSISMVDLAEFLGRKLDREVVDKTNLNGLFDLAIAPWSPFLNGVPSNRAGGAVDSRPTLFVAVEEQLGLKLSSGESSLDTIAIDDVSAPTEN